MKTFVLKGFLNKEYKGFKKIMLHGASIFGNPNGKKIKCVSKSFKEKQTEVILQKVVKQ